MAPCHAGTAIDTRHGPWPCRWGSLCLIPPWRGWVAAPMPAAPRAMWPRRTLSTCSMGEGSGTQGHDGCCLVCTRPRLPPRVRPCTYERGACSLLCRTRLASGCHWHPPICSGLASNMVLIWTCFWMPLTSSAKRWGVPTTAARHRRCSAGGRSSRKLAVVGSVPRGPPELLIWWLTDQQARGCLIHLDAQ